VDTKKDHVEKNLTRSSRSRSVSLSRSPTSRSRSRENLKEFKRSHSKERRHHRDWRRDNRSRSHSYECYSSRERSRSSSPGGNRTREGKHNREDRSPSQDDRRRGRKRSRTRQEGDNRPEDIQAQTYPKKKKEYKATSSFIGDDEFEDILERGWFYVDSNGDKQGPFTTKEMKEWYVAGFFNNELMVKRVSDPTFQKISDRDEFKQLERKPSIQIYAPTNTFEQVQEQENAQNPYYQDFPAFYDPSYEQEPQETQNDDDPSNYVQAAFFTTLKGRFSAGDQATHWKKKGLPTDKDGRMLSHYFDVEAYQEQMRNCEPPQKKKVTKNMIKYYKKKERRQKKETCLNALKSHQSLLHSKK